MLTLHIAPPQPITDRLVHVFYRSLTHLVAAWVCARARSPLAKLSHEQLLELLVLLRCGPMAVPWVHVEDLVHVHRDHLRVFLDTPGSSNPNEVA